MGSITVTKMPWNLAGAKVDVESTCVVDNKSVWWILMNPTRAHIVSFYDEVGNLVKELRGKYTTNKIDDLLEESSVITIKHENICLGGISVVKDGEFWNVSIIPINYPKDTSSINYVHSTLFNSIKNSYRAVSNDHELEDMVITFYHPTYHGATISWE